MAMPFQKQLLTIEEFERAWEGGAFPPDARLELIRGEVVEMSPIGDPHFLSVMFLGDLLSELRPGAISACRVRYVSPCRIGPSAGRRRLPAPVEFQAAPSTRRGRPPRRRGLGLHPRL